MVLAFDLSAKMKLCSQEDPARAVSHLKALGLKTKISDISPSLKCTADELVVLMAGDKKVQAGKIGFILSRGIGEAFQNFDVDIDIVTDVVRRSLEG